ncbi:prolactin-releasing peptide receptor-like [Stylophora pistillata]|uniref:prolactin-releasing peptide receptor-like n=1 Tax=Stylophora pistillata TaxID=50429 RepID=UPI000C044DD1|nr:prolactin-releasing peptide receptor-like [Stylophora pistillata]
MIHGVFGDVMCKGVVYTVFVSVTASILCLTLMAIDRYYAIVHPLRRHLWFRKYKITVPLIWIWSLASMAIFLPTQHLEEHNSQCMLSVYILGDPDKAIQGIFLYLVLIHYLIPLIVISSLHAIAAWKLWFHVVPGNENSIRNQQETSKKRVVRMLIIVTFAFALCWLPAHVVHVIIVMEAWNIEVTLWPIVTFLCFWFGHANSAINPWLYIFLSSKINTEFKRIVYRKRGRSPTSLCVKTQKEENERHDKEPKDEAAELESRL